MTTTQSILPLTRDELIALSDRKQEPKWLLDARLSAFDSAGQLELPYVEKVHIKRWDLDSYGVYKEASQLESIDKLPAKLKGLLHEGSNDNVVIQRNSNVVYSSISAELQEQGVIFMGIDQAVKEHPELVQKYLNTAIEIKENKLAAAHAAIWSGGVFLYVPKNTQVSVPVQALFYNDDTDALFSPHILVVVEDHSSVTYIDNYLSENEDKSLVQNGAVEVFAGHGAEVHFASIHNLSDNITDLNYRRAVLQNDAKMNWIVGEMNYGNTLSDTNSILVGTGSESDANVICVGTGEQQMSITTRCTHIGRNTNSNMQTRGVMKDKVRAIINGVTKMERGATNANGEQTERILMLSPDARGDANPILLIDEDDVLAGHAASAGQVDPMQLFYLMSRGIPEELAVKLVVYGFLAPVVSSVPLEHVEEQFRNLVERKLGQ